MENTPKYYWRVTTKNKVVYLHADRLKITEHEALVFFVNDFPIYTFAKGYWREFYSASIFDGGCKYIEHVDPISETDKYEDN